VDGQDRYLSVTVEDRVTAEYVTPVDNEETPFEDDWTVARGCVSTS
jgi:hypothetical protein